MDCQQKDQQQPQQQLKRAIKEEAAKAVVRDASHRGYKCVELGHDGRRPIFFCIHCNTRCYTDVSLWAHLNGNVHARRMAAVTGVQDTSSDCKMKEAVPCRQQQQQQQQQHDKKQLMDFSLPPPQLNLKLVDQGLVFLKLRPCSSKVVEACWFEKRPLLTHGVQQAQHGEVVYAIVVFTYSEGLGRSSSSNKATTAAVQLKSGRGRKRAKVADRICFICRQKMVPNKEVASLLNVSNKQPMMMCHSRNLRGAFHVYHVGCLIGWILMFNAKQWMGQSLSFRRHYRNSLMAEGSGSELTAVCSPDKPLFCPECQGTGMRLHGGQLERPRYRLAQIFEWVLQLVQTRKVWLDHFGHETTGLMFHASKGVSHPRDFESSLVFPLSTLRIYWEVDSKPEHEEALASKEM